MIFSVSVIILFLISFILAVRSARTELIPPREVNNLKITKKNKISGVILFLKKKIVHYKISSS